MNLMTGTRHDWDGLSSSCISLIFILARNRNQQPAEWDIEYVCSPKNWDTSASKHIILAAPVARGILQKFDHLPERKAFYGGVLSL